MSESEKAKVQELIWKAREAQSNTTDAKYRAEIEKKIQAAYKLLDN